MKRATQTFLWLVLLLGSLAITVSSIVYFNFGERPPFVIEKLPLPNENLYLYALRLHVLAAALALPGCLFLSSKTSLRRWPRVHRWSGRIVGGIVMLALVPSGGYLAFFARGGLAGTLGFLLSGSIVAIAMVQAVREARAKRFAKHRLFAFHVLGQLSVAVTSRVMLFALESSNLDPNAAYIASLWVPVVGTFVLVQWLVAPNSLQSLSRSLYEKMVDPAGPIPRRSLDIR